MSKVGGLSVHELGGNYYIIMFILNTSGIGYYNYLVYLINMFFIWPIDSFQFWGGSAPPYKKVGGAQAPPAPPRFSASALSL